MNEISTSVLLIIRFQKKKKKLKNPHCIYEFIILKKVAQSGKQAMKWATNRDFLHILK